MLPVSQLRAVTASSEEDPRLLRAGLDRAREQGQRDRSLGRACLMQGSCGKSRDGTTLTDADEVHAGPQVPERGNRCLDVLLKAETADRHRNVARVHPIENGDVVCFQQAGGKIAHHQNMTARHRHDQQRRRPWRLFRNPQLKKCAERIKPDMIADNRTGTRANERMVDLQAAPGGLKTRLCNQMQIQASMFVSMVFGSF